MLDAFGHGHVWERPDGMKARCGGPGICRECSIDEMRLREAADAQSPVHVAMLLKAKDYWQEEADRLRRENLELRACFSAASQNLSSKEVSKIVADAKDYIERTAGADFKRDTRCVGRGACTGSADVVPKQDV